MKRILLFSMMVLGGTVAYSQSTESAANLYTNSADNLLLNDNKLVVGGYGEVHYNQPMDVSTYNNGKADVHRVVMLFGYNFTDKTQFVTELDVITSYSIHYTKLYET